MIQTAADLSLFLQSIQTPETFYFQNSNDEFNGKMRLYFDIAKAILTWNQPDSTSYFNFTADFPVVLQAIVVKVDQAIANIQSIPNEDDRAVLISSVNSARDAFLIRIERFKTRNDKFWNCYYRLRLEPRVTMLRIQLQNKMDALTEKIRTINVPQIPPAPQFKKAPLFKAIAPNPADAAMSPADAAMSPADAANSDAAPPKPVLSYKKPANANQFVVDSNVLANLKLKGKTGQPSNDEKTNAPTPKSPSAMSTAEIREVARKNAAAKALPPNPMHKPASKDRG